MNLVVSALILLHAASAFAVELEENQGLPPGVNLPQGVNLPPGVNLPQNMPANLPSNLPQNLPQGAYPSAPPMPQQRGYSPEGSADAAKRLKTMPHPADSDYPPSNMVVRRRNSLRSGRPFASHEDVDVSNAEEAGVKTRKVLRAARKAGQPEPKPAKPSNGKAP